ncbi:Resolvase domain [Methylobacterium sp. 4-46]|uniref:recombinase family protein n=1 Tax=unclassified Methylobacterium TaxID=2615210 RepID=UPI000152DF44|nr:recombinase family protein [Methylobacterium sp. 4-46]ACA21150.1 Resolvase domain [Methylobacterium sp. 4-46]
MTAGKFVTYVRVSTAKQGRSGLGLDAQREAVARYLGEARRHVVGEFIEVESGKRADRPELAKAIDACRLYRAKLIVAKLDRLSRDPGFLRDLERSGVDFVAADMPDANRLTVGIMALIAEHEREAISTRTKAALAAAKARGTKMGGFPGPDLHRGGSRGRQGRQEGQGRPQRGARRAGPRGASRGWCHLDQRHRPRPHRARHPDRAGGGPLYPDRGASGVEPPARRLRPAAGSDAGWRWAFCL